VTSRPLITRLSPRQRHSIMPMLRLQVEIANVQEELAAASFGGFVSCNKKSKVESCPPALQVEAAKVQEELAAASFEGFSEDETVCVTMTGNQEPVGCDITDEARLQRRSSISINQCPLTDVDLIVEENRYQEPISCNITDKVRLEE